MIGSLTYYPDTKYPKNELSVDSIIEFDGLRYMVTDYCKPCKLVWAQRMGKKKPKIIRKKYSEVKLILP